MLLIDHLREVARNAGEVLAKGWPLTYRFHEPESPKAQQCYARNEWARLCFTGPGRAELHSIITREAGCEWNALRVLEHEAQHGRTEDDRELARRKVQALYERVAWRVAESRAARVVQPQFTDDDIPY